VISIFIRGTRYDLARVDIDVWEVRTPDGALLGVVPEALSDDVERAVTR